MFKMRQILAISILDSPIQGNIYLGEYEGKFLSVCVVRAEESPLFQKDEEHDAFHAAKDWFSNEYDGFTKVEALGCDESAPEVKEFRKIIGRRLFDQK